MLSMRVREVAMGGKVRLKVEEFSLEVKSVK